MADVGTTLTGNRGTYTLTALLGDGLTARVFQATASYLESPVAVKILRPGLPPEIIDRFQSEFKNVTDINARIDTASRTTEPSDNGDDGPASPPAFYEFLSQQDDQPAFLVLELMSGRKLEHQLIEDGPLPELLGLRAGAQLFGMFHVMHQEVGNTYADFKFENLWWERDRTRLRVTDWNVLGDPAKLGENIPTDLERAARALVRILTGVSVSRGQRLDLQPRWETLSDGAQRLLLRLLDVDRTRRPGSADAGRQEMRRLISYWQIAPERGLRMAEAALAGAGSSLIDGDLDDETRQTVERTALHTLDLLSILHARQITAGAEGTDPWPAERVHQLDELLAKAQGFAPSADKMLEGAVNLLNGGSTAKALEQFQRANRVFPDDLRSFRWREYAEAAVAGKAGPEGVQRQWRDAIVTCNHGEYTIASRKLSGLDEGLAPALRDEIAIYIAIGDVDLHDNPSETLQSVFRANEALQDLRGLNTGYALAVERGLGRDLAELVQFHRERVAAANRDAEVARELTFYNVILQSPARVPEGAAHAEERLRLFIDQESVLLAVLKLGDKCLEQGSYDVAKRIFSAGAVLEHARTRDFLLRWQVANVAALRKNEPAGEITAREIATTRLAIEEASQNLEPESTQFKKLNWLLEIVDPESPKLATKQFDAALENALKENRANTVDIIGKKLKAQELAAALSLALEPKGLDSTTRNTLARIIQANFGISAAVLTILTAQKSPVKDALASAKDNTAAVAIAQAVKLPQDIDLLTKLMSALPSSVDKVKLANQLRDLAFQFGAERDGKPVPVPVPVPIPLPDPVPPVPPPVPKSSIEELLAALDSNDPQRWEQVIQTPEAKRDNWTEQLTSKATQRERELKTHRREMEDVFRGFETDPVAVKERMSRWRYTHHFANLWDRRNSHWVDQDALWYEVQRAADTVQANRWLLQAQQKMGSETRDKVMSMITTGLTFRNADPPVLSQLEMLQEQTKSVGHAVNIIDSASPPYAQSTFQSHLPGSIGALLEAPLRESETLAQLHIRLSTLAQDETNYSRKFTKLALDLQVWVEEERWLNYAEEQQKNGRLQETIKSHATAATRNLESLIQTEAWHSYVTKETPAFANTLRRLRPLTGQ